MVFLNLRNVGSKTIDFFNCASMAVATTIGTLVAYFLVPMRSLGQDSWKIAAALMGRHIGGGNK